MLKVARPILSIPFSDICNTSFIEGIFPEKDKVAKVIPSHKKGCTNDVNNYRPISLLSIFSNILEKLIVTKLTTYLTYTKYSTLNLVLDLDIQLLIP